MCVSEWPSTRPTIYHRPVSLYAAHGYGTVLLAGAEMIELIRNAYPRINDSAIQFYSKPIDTDGPTFSEPE